MSIAAGSTDAASSRVKSVDEALTLVISSLENEQNLKKQIRESLEPLEDIHRPSLSELNKLHSSPSSSHADICTRSLNTITQAHPHWLTVANLIPKGEFYRYQFALGPIMKNFVNVISLAKFILSDELVPAFTVASLMGVEQEGTESIHLSAEDYLQGVIGMVNELPRLSINSVTAQNFGLPVKIASFVNDIFASYSLLNLRNDALRRKFDSLKYDLKRCEDVVYDLTLRGLTAPKS